VKTDDCPFHYLVNVPNSVNLETGPMAVVDALSDSVAVLTDLSEENHLVADLEVDSLFELENSDY
jgi:hypothetical protein